MVNLEEDEEAVANMVARGVVELGNAGVSYAAGEEERGRFTPGIHTAQESRESGYNQ